MLGLFEEEEEVFFLKYLEFYIIDRFDGRRSWLIGDESDLSEKSSRTYSCYFLSSLENSNSSMIDIVGLTIRR